ncbi:hypothetical protein BASA83_002351 [Batrachochytrium salamandrivorans]|nr:hypothetical protein BASA83_002351 [Batrachochytrium salamandrivorans]
MHFGMSNGFYCFSTHGFFLSLLLSPGLDVDSIGRFYRLNDLKFLDWLKAKVEHLANKAACHSIDAFIPLVQDAKLVHNISDDSSLHRRIAFQAICEHINVKWMNLLMTHLSISDESIWSKQHVYFTQRSLNGLHRLLQQHTQLEAN